MSCSKLLEEMRAAGFTPCAQHVFFVLREQASCSEDGRAPGSGRWLEESTGWSRGAVRAALAALERAGWISIRRGNRRQPAIINIEVHRLASPQKSPQKSPLNTPKTQLELIDHGPTESPQKSPTVVSGCYGVSPGVITAVNSPVSTEVLQQGAPEKIGAPPRVGSIPKNPERPGWNQLRAFVTATWTAKKKGAPMITGRGDWVQVYGLSGRFTCGELAVLWKAFLDDDDPLVVRNGHRMGLFPMKIGYLVDRCAWKEEGAKIMEKWCPPDPGGVRALSELLGGIPGWVAKTQREPRQANARGPVLAQNAPDGG